jgi:hypothetical protein
MLYLSQQVAQQNLGDASNLQYASAPQPFLGYFTLRRIESARIHGYLFFHLYPGPVGPQSYIESVYFALADKTLGPGGLAIASGVADNTPENPRKWLRFPDAIKPGARMPAMGLSERKVEAVASYLETLR